jgi:hypothetical protein
MNNRYKLAFGVVVAIFYTPACFAGPCSPQIDAMQAKIDARLAAAAAAGPSGKETTAATMDRQPTPKSIAEAEVKLGDISAQTVQAVGDAMARARKADLAGDKAGCEQALSDVKKTMGN